MGQAVASRDADRWGLPYVGQATARRGEPAGCCAGSFGLEPLPGSSTPRESGSAPGLSILEVPDEGIDDHIPADVLLLDEEPARMAEQLRQAFPAPAHRVQVAGPGAAGLQHVRADAPDVIVLGLGVPEQSAWEVYQQIRRINGRVPVIVVARTGLADVAIEAMKLGAYDCLFQPLDPPLLRQVVGGALAMARRMRAPAVVAETAADPDAEGAIVGSCPTMRQVYKDIGRVAGQNLPVLITGESGTGKELVARAIYQHGPRAKAPFLALNCAAIPEQLLESELFGHEKGAFTGADRRRIGKFEQVSGGTLFLDEVGDMPPALQAKVLRLLQEQAFERVGGNETVRTDVRLIAATHRDLKAWSAEGKFRPDLYYRLGVFTIHLPPLRERGDDLVMLVRHFLRRFSRELGREVCEVAPEALARLRGNPWPGNVRELQSVLKQALLHACGPVLLPAFLPESLEGPSEPAPAPLAGVKPGLEVSLRVELGPDVRHLYAEAHRQLDRLLLSRVLEYTRGSQQQAALLLGMARQTVRQKLRELGLAVRPPAEGEEDDLP
jgi:DNA-binding NtrC family response regulator